jgi:hypothetical protein
MSNESPSVQLMYANKNALRKKEMLFHFITICFGENELNSSQIRKRILALYGKEYSWIKLQVCRP